MRLALPSLSLGLGLGPVHAAFSWMLLPVLPVYCPTVLSCQVGYKVHIHAHTLHRASCAISRCLSTRQHTTLNTHMRARHITTA